MVASSLISTEPIGAQDKQGKYLNGCIRFRFSESIEELFASLRSTEKKSGRVRRERWGARSVDLDLLLCDDEIVDTHELQIPHPRMSFRRFVLEPAVEVAGEMTNPLSGLTINQHLDCLNSRPDNVVIASDRLSSHSDALKNQLSPFESRGWRFQYVSEWEQIQATADTIKLLVYSRDLSGEIRKSARQFPGATLDASLESGEINISEIVAAIEAMCSW